VTELASWLYNRTIEDNKYIPHTPTEKQEEALLCNTREAFYGGSAGGGKSDYLLMEALRWVDSEDYSCIIFRKTYADLARAGALMSRSHEWLASTDAKWNGTDKMWRFPSGATVGFGYMEHEKDKYNYQGGEWNAILFDEVTHFSESQYRYLFSRLRKIEGSIIPSKIRCTGNPDGIGFGWVKSRFVSADNPSRPYISSKLEDNPYLNIADYEESLSALDPVTFQKLRHGDWEVRTEGAFFKTNQIEIVDEYPVEYVSDSVRRWDLASTPENGSNDPDYTVGAKLAMIDGKIYILDIVRGRWAPDDVDKEIKQAAMVDGPKVRIIAEEEGGSSGKRTTEQLTRMLAGFSFCGKRTTGNKEVNARPYASWVNQGRVKMLRGYWNEAVLDEMALFPLVSHDDQVDACSGAFNDLSTIPKDVPFTSEGFSAMQSEQANLF